MRPCLSRLRLPLTMAPLSPHTQLVRVTAKEAPSRLMGGSVLWPPRASCPLLSTLPPSAGQFLVGLSLGCRDQQKGLRRISHPSPHLMWQNYPEAARSRGAWSWWGLSLDPRPPASHSPCSPRQHRCRIESGSTSKTRGCGSSSATSWPPLPGRPFLWLHAVSSHLKRRSGEAWVPLPCCVIHVSGTPSGRVGAEPLCAVQAGALGRTWGAPGAHLAGDRGPGTSLAGTAADSARGGAGQGTSTSRAGSRQSATCGLRP